MAGASLCSHMGINKLMKKTTKGEVAHEENYSKNVGSDTNTKYVASVQQIMSKHGEVLVPHQTSTIGIQI